MVLDSIEQIERDFGVNIYDSYHSTAIYFPPGIHTADWNSIYQRIRALEAQEKVEPQEVHFHGSPRTTPVEIRLRDDGVTDNTEVLRRAGFSLLPRGPYLKELEARREVKP